MQVKKSCLMINLIIEAKVIVKTSSMAKEHENTSHDVIKTQSVSGFVLIVSICYPLCSVIKPEANSDAPCIVPLFKGGTPVLEMICGQKNSQEKPSIPQESGGSQDTKTAKTEIQADRPREKCPFWCFI